VFPLISDKKKPPPDDKPVSGKVEFSINKGFLGSKGNVTAKATVSLEKSTFQSGEFINVSINCDNSKVHKAIDKIGLSI
jgi:sporulation-control protein spo0M